MRVLAAALGCFRGSSCLDSRTQHATVAALHAGNSDGGEQHAEDETVVKTVPLRHSESGTAPQRLDRTSTDNNTGATNGISKALCSALASHPVAASHELGMEPRLAKKASEDRQSRTLPRISHAADHTTTTQSASHPLFGTEAIQVCGQVWPVLMDHYY